MFLSVSIVVLGSPLRGSSSALEQHSCCSWNWLLWEQCEVALGISMDAFYCVNPKIVLSDVSLCVSHASQSLLVVGNSPIPLTFHKPRPSASRFMAM